MLVILPVFISNLSLEPRCIADNVKAAQFSPQPLDKPIITCPVGE
jgi:hypothetical protein